ncbi:MAG: CusA/CzcA family heavy metal efflux RND transporter [Pseudomonadales bacterium]
MIEWLIRSAVEHRVLVLMFTALIVGWGVYAVREMPIDAIPDLSDVQVIVKTSYPGQAPQVVEDQVTYPLTTAMLAVPRAVTVRGYSFFGDSYVYVIFEDGTDLYWARSRVLEYLSQGAASLPPDARTSLGPDATGVGWIYSYALVDRSGRHDIAELRSIQDFYLKYELQSLPGVAEVATAGGMVKQYQVTVDPDRLRAYDLPLAHVRESIRRANAEAGASVVEIAEAEYMVRASGYLGKVEDLRQVPLGKRVRGEPLLLGDVADVVEGPQMRRGVVDLDGDGEAVGGIIVMRFGANAREVIRAVKSRLELLRGGLPEGVELVTTYDRSSLIDRAVSNLYRSLAEEFAVVALICALFLLHLRSSLVAVLSVPVGILAAFIVMRLQRVDANIMSLGGIAIAIGAMVDGAIVMIENMHRHIEQGSVERIGRWPTVVAAAGEVGSSLFFSLLIITVSFVPVFALEAQEGRLFHPLAFTKTYAMAAAAVLAVTLVPVLVGYFVRGRVRAAADNPFNALLTRLYAPLLLAVLRRPATTVFGALVVVLLGFWPLTRLGSEFMPPLDEGDLMYMPTTYPGISIGKARELLQQTDRLIRTVPEVKTVFGKVGRAETATDPAPLTMIETVVQLRPRAEWRSGVTPESLRAELNALVSFPGVSNAWVMPIRARIDMLATGIKTPVGIKIAGSALGEIERIGRQLEELLPGVSGTASVYAERVAGGRYIKVDIDRERAARFGLNVADVQDVVRTAIGGMNITETVEGRERYPVNLRYPQKYRDSPERLGALPLITADNQRITLSDVARIYVESGPPAIKSENARLNGWVFVDIIGRDIGSYVAEARALVAKSVDLPPGYSLAWAGQYEYLQRVAERLTLVVPLTLALIVVLLFLNFRALDQVLLILTTLPFGLVGGFWLVWLLDFDLSVAVWVGFIALAGLAAELGVLMVAYLNQACAGRTAPADLRAAVLDGASRRVRPILMTASTVFLGLMPVMLNDATGSEVMQRIAAPMVGGMISTLVLTLVVVPAAYFLLRTRRRAAAEGTCAPGDTQLPAPD